MHRLVSTIRQHGILVELVEEGSLDSTLLVLVLGGRDDSQVSQELCGGHLQQLSLSQLQPAFAVKIDVQTVPRNTCCCHMPRRVYQVLSPFLLLDIWPTKCVQLYMQCIVRTAQVQP